MADAALAALGIETSGMKRGEQEAVRSLQRVESEMQKAEKQADRLSKELGGSITRSGNAFQGFGQAVKGASTSLESLGGPIGRASGAMSGMVGQAKELVGGLGLVGGAAVAAVAGIAAVAAGFVKLSIDASKSADELLDVAEGTGLTVDQVQLLGAAMQRAGEDISAVERSFRSFQSAVIQAIKDPSSDAAKNLRAMGVNAREAGRDMGGAFVGVIASLKEVRSTTLGAAASNEVLGKGIGALARSSGDTAELLGKTNEELRSMGILANKVALEDAAKLDTQLNRLSQSAQTLKINLSGLGQGIVSTALGALAAVLERINAALNDLNNMKSGAKQGASIIGQAFQQGPYAALSRQRELSPVPPPSEDKKDDIIIPPSGGGRPFASPGATAQALDEQRRLNAEYEVSEIRASDLSEAIRETNVLFEKLRQEMKILAGSAEFPAVVEQFLQTNARRTALAARGPALPTLSEEDRKKLIGLIPSAGTVGPNDIGPVVRETDLGQGSKTTIFGEDDREILKREFGYIFEDFYRSVITGRATMKEAFGYLAIGILDTFATAMLQSMQRSFIDPLVKGLTNLLTNALDGLFGSLTSGGGFGKILGSIGKFFGGFFADGGVLAPGHFGVAGEKGPELIFSGSRPMTIMPMGAMAGGGISLNVSFAISTPDGNVPRRTQDQIADSVLQAVQRAQRQRGA